jgi:shikimate kinase
LNVIFIGPPGSGKTSVGQVLAQITNRRFFDTDRLLEERAGTAVTEIFSKHGESHFRQLESALLDEIKEDAWQDLILATGGGIVITPGNLDRLSAIGHVICLIAQADCLAERLRSDDSRPLLNSPDHETKVKRLQDLLGARNQFYEQAEHVINTAGLTPEEVAKKVEKLLCMSDITSKTSRSSIKCSNESTPKGKLSRDQSS